LNTQRHLKVVATLTFSQAFESIPHPNTTSI
jgi:hypothetical protein